MSTLRAGALLALGSVVLFAISVAGVAPWVAGDDPGCSETGPNPLFLFFWLASAALALVALALIARTPRSALKLTATAASVAVLAAAAGWFVIVVVDGIRECGF